MIWMQEKPLDLTTQVKALQILNGLLRWCGNATLDQMRSKRLLPVRPRKEIKSLTEDEVSHIIKSASRVGGWRGEIAKFMCAVYSYTGLRTSELRLAQLIDLDEQNWTIWVRHPKGEKRYGVKRTAPIPPPIRPIVLEYLQKRHDYLKERGVEECDPLIPRVSQKGKTGYYSLDALESIKRYVEHVAGTKFKLKELRTSFGQILKDRGVSIESISKVMGHSTTKTTELYYARIRDISAFSEINDVWVGNPDTSENRNSKKRIERTLDGYA